MMVYPQGPLFTEADEALEGMKSIQLQTGRNEWLRTKRNAAQRSKVSR
jgi:hypothetical protein